MMCKVHRRPVEHRSVAPYKPRAPGEEMAHEERSDRSVACVQRGEGTEDDGGVGECHLVAARAEQSVYTWTYERDTFGVVGSEL